MRFLAVVVCVFLFVGCGGALRTQARAATISSLVAERGHALALDAARTRIEECETAECVDRVESSFAPVVLAYESVRAALTAWVDALRLAAIAGEDQDVLAALFEVAGRFAALWEEFKMALEGVGVELP